jgi:hypothetical protein
LLEVVPQPRRKEVKRVEGSVRRDSPGGGRRDMRRSDGGGRLAVSLSKATATNATDPCVSN